ncbi:MAG TPA: hypothetical protein EYN66_16915, partial [Myxococcales bacterium]|nr:hypothetical protein [Myxococcales bacterium]
MATTEGHLQYGIATVANDWYLNLAHDLSIVNQRGYGATDKSGDLLTYVCDFEFLTTGENSIHIYTAPETWKTKA